MGGRVVPFRQNVLVIMTLSGTLVVVLYYVLYPLALRYSTAKWRYHFLKMALLFYLFPFPEFKYLFISIFNKYFGSQEGLMEQEYPHIINYAESIIIRPDGKVVFSELTRNILLVAVLVGGCTVAIVTTQLFRYFRAKHILMHDESNAQPPERLLVLFEKSKYEIKVDVKTRLILSDYVEVPMTLGIFSPTVVFPHKLTDWGDEELYNVMKHELIHIQHKDLIIKFIGLLVMAVHWYNPFCILLFKELSGVSELYCDMRVISGKDEDAIKRYGELIINMAVDNEDIYRNNNLLSVRLIGNDAKRIKRRIKEMKKRERISRLFSVIALVLVFHMALSITIFAYVPPVINENLNLKANQSYNWGEFVNGSIESIDCNDFSVFDNIFVDHATGKVYNGNVKNPKPICFHDFVSGTQRVHSNDGNGGCCLDYYYAERCTICGYIITGDKFNTVTFEVCPH